MIPMNDRVAYVDVAKGIVMSAVVFHHCVSAFHADTEPFWGDAVDYIGSFHMAMFFMLSGFFAKADAWLTFFRKKWHSLLLPLVVVYLFSFLVALAIQRLMPGVLKNDVSIWNIFLSHSFTNGPIWFLSSLFASLVLFQAVLHLTREWQRALAVVILSTIGYYWNAVCPLRMPLFWDVGFTALVFVYLGYHLRRWLDMVDNKLILSLLAFVGMALPFLVSFSLCKQDNANQGPIYFSVPVVSIVSIGFCSFAKLIDSCRPLQYVGRYSLIFLCFHNFFVMAVSILVARLGLHDSCSIALGYILVMSLTSAFVIPVRRYLGRIF